MKILSFDVGIKNLSYCYLDVCMGNTREDSDSMKTSLKMIEWNNICTTEEGVNCAKIKLDDLTMCVLNALHDTFDEAYEADVVLIENQPMLKNGQMKTVAVIIYTYFNMLKLQYGSIKDVKFISATNKLKCKEVPVSDQAKSKTSSYKDRKLLSVEVARTYIAKLFPEREVWFQGLKKKDDASDVLLQAIYYIEHVLKIKLS